MVRKPPGRTGARHEQLVVRWRTIGGSGRGIASFLFPGDKEKGDDYYRGGGGEDGGRDKVVGTAQRVGDGREFTGLFIFEFDGEGRVLSHTIEHVEEGGQWERGVGAKVVGLTDWLLGGFKNGVREGEDTPCPAFVRRKER